MTAERRRFGSFTKSMGLLFDAIVIFVLLLSGFSVIFIGKITGQVATRFLILGVGLAVEILGIILASIYAYFRLLRGRGTENT